jgi:hypothetical protein
MRLTEPLRPDPANADSDTYGLAAPAQVSFPSSDLAELRFAAIATGKKLEGRQEGGLGRGGS